MYREIKSTRHFFNRDNTVFLGFDEETMYIYLYVFAYIYVCIMYLYEFAIFCWTRSLKRILLEIPALSVRERDWPLLIRWTVFNRLLPSVGGISYYICNMYIYIYNVFPRLMLQDKTTAAGLTDNTIKKRVVLNIYIYTYRK